MAGNRQGPRAWYSYTSDTGTVYAIFTDIDLAAAAGLTAAVLGTPEKPSRLTPRYLTLKSITGSLTSKRLICNASNSNYSNGGQVTVDGEVFQVTGRVGEKLTFPQLAVPGP